MKDAQTIGGYPRIAKVPDRDLWRLGQLKVGDRVKFQLKPKFPPGDANG
jgi:allophanate hydrolase subunit 2